MELLRVSFNNRAKRVDKNNFQLFCVLLVFHSHVLFVITQLLQHPEDRLWPKRISFNVEVTLVGLNQIVARSK